jgi:hypothetical protein
MVQIQQPVLVCFEEKLSLVQYWKEVTLHFI